MSDSKETALGLAAFFSGLFLVFAFFSNFSIDEDQPKPEVTVKTTEPVPSCEPSPTE